MPPETAAAFNPPVIVDPSGKPARRRQDQHCPGCGAGPDRRVASGGYGNQVHDVCSRCGHDFEESTT